MLQTRALTEQQTAVRRALLRPDQLIDWVPLACAVVAEHLRHHGIAPAGFPFARSHRVHSFLLEVEAGFPVATPVAPSGLVDRSALPGGLALAGWHRGPHETVDLTYQEIHDWLETRGAIRTGDGWEIYHDLPTCDHLGTRIEIIQPVSLVPAMV